MQFRFFMPTKVLFGQECILQNQGEFAQFGKRALLVTGRNSARISGALDDACTVLEQQGIAWEIFDQIGENPTFAMVEAGGSAAREFCPDMLVAIGGGSPLDAAKAIAVLAKNDIPAIKLYDGNFLAAPLPILAVPTTAGTGSEVTAASVLTYPEKQTKRSFSDPRLFPRVAFLDARYTESLSHRVTVDTAVDALSHCVEGYLSKRSSPTSDALALEGIRCFGKAINALTSGAVSLTDRETLLYSALLGGMVVAQAGTTLVHALGYSLTYFKNVPHGRANGLLLGEFLFFHEPVATKKIACVLQAMQIASVSDFQKLISALIPHRVELTDQEMESYAAIAEKNANVVYTARKPTHEDLLSLLSSALIS